MNHTIIKHYQEQIDNLKAMGDPDLLYHWIIDLGRQLQKNPLPEEKRHDLNRVSRCQYSLFVDLDDGTFKAWSDGLIASGYAFILTDIFNHLSRQEAAKIDPGFIFESLDIGSILSMSRSNGFYQMIDMLKEKTKP